MPIEITEVEWRYYVLTALRELEQESPEEDGFPLAEIYDRVEEKIEADFLSTAETNCARWRRKSVPAWMNRKGMVALPAGGVGRRRGSDFLG